MLVVKEHEELKGLREDEQTDLEKFALANQTDGQGNYRPVFSLKNNRLYAQNYVGIIETRRRTVLEILPKVDLAEGEDTEKTETKRVFFKMLRSWRGLKSLAQFNESHIDAVRSFNMLEVFVHLFLNNLVLLTQRGGLARHYQPEEGNLPCLRGRILFPQHIRENSANRARFYVGYDEFNANRPANRLIHSTIHKLIGFVRQPRNQQLLHQLRIFFSDIPQSVNLESDWDQHRHRMDRSTQHYGAVMQWVGLFLFDHGLTTFAGKHVNQALLFPMWEVFEDFVAACFRRYQQQFSVREQGPQKSLASIEGEGVFYMKPDICLMSGDKTKFILDTKWKRINEDSDYPKHGISQADMYQLFAYGKKYSCKQVALVYPKTEQFQKKLRYKFDEELSLSCFPFDVNNPEDSVETMLNDLRD